MPTDPAIVVQAGQVAYPDLGAIIGAANQLKQQRFQLQQLQQQQEQQNWLKSVTSAPGATDPATGRLTSNTLAEITRRDPADAIKYIQAYAIADDKEANAARYNSEAAVRERQGAASAMAEGTAYLDDPNVDPAEALKAAKQSVYDYIDAQPWSDQKKQQQKAHLADLTAVQFRAMARAAEAGSATPAERAEANKVTPYFDPSTGRTVFVGSERDASGAVPVVDQSGKSAEISGPIVKSGGAAPKPQEFSDAQGNLALMWPQADGSVRWTDAGGKPIEPPTGQVTHVLSGAPRSAPALALQAFMRTDAYQNASADERPNLLAQFNAGFHAVQIGATASAKADQSSLTNVTKIADASEAFEHTAMANFDQALSLAPKGVKTNMGPLLERWVQDPAKALGDPSVPAYQAALLTAANEYAKVIAGSTGSQGSTVDSRREAAEMFSSFYSTDQIKAVINVAKTDMDNKIASYAGQREAIKARLSGETGVSDVGGLPGEGGETPPTHRPAEPPALPGAEGYRTAQDVIAAYQHGKISRAKATSILTGDFGYRP